MRLADLNFESVNRIVVARLVGEFDMSNNRDVGRALLGRVTNDALGLVLDLTGTRYVDSAGINTLIYVRNQLKHRGQEIRLVVPAGAEIAEALQIVGISTVTGVTETVEAAIESIEAQTGNPQPGL
jgi:anti-anti-sigma factor